VLQVCLINLYYSAGCLLSCTISLPDSGISVRLGLRGMHSDGKNSACVLKDVSNTDTVGLKARSGENWITGAQVHCKLQALALEPQQRRCQQDVDEVLRSIREQKLVYSAQHALDIHTSLCHMGITVDTTMYDQLGRRSPVTNSERVANAILTIQVRVWSLVLFMEHVFDIAT